MSYAAISQSSNDTLCFTREQAIRVLTAAKKSAILDSVIIKMREDIQNYETAIKWFQDVIAQQDKKDSAMVASYNREIATMQAIQFEFASQVTDLKKQLKKAQRGKKFMSFLALVAAGAGVYLAVK